MAAKPKKLSETARALLTAMAARDDHLIWPSRLPVAAARHVVRSLLNTGGCRGDYGSELILRATELGLSCLQAEDCSSLVPPTAATLVESDVSADDATPPEPPIAGGSAVDEPQLRLMPPRRHGSPQSHRPPRCPLTPSRRHL